MNIQEICDEYPEDSRFIGPEYPGATHFIGDLGMSRRFMFDRPLKGLRNVEKKSWKILSQNVLSWN